MDCIFSAVQLDCFAEYWNSYAERSTYIRRGACRPNRTSYRTDRTEIPNFLQTLTWSKVPEDSSDFDDSVCVFIVMTWSFIWDLLRKFRPKIFSESRRPAEFTESRRPSEIIFRILPRYGPPFERLTLCTPHPLWTLELSDFPFVSLKEHCQNFKRSPPSFLFPR